MKLICNFPRLAFFMHKCAVCAWFSGVSFVLIFPFVQRINWLCVSLISRVRFEICNYIFFISLSFFSLLIFFLFLYRKFRPLPLLPIVKPHNKPFPIQVNLLLQLLQSVHFSSFRSIFLNGLHQPLHPQMWMKSNKILPQTNSHSNLRLMWTVPICCHH